MKDRKETYRNSTKKRNQKLKELGLVTLNTHINEDDKNTLIRIQNENKFRILGDAISYIINKHTDKDNWFHAREQ